MTTEPTMPPMAASNEAEPDQLDVARAEGGAYARALEAMDEESGAVTRRTGRRYERPADVVFEDRRFTPGRKPSPDARPRGADSSYAGR
ncbi:MAG TPA: hypothetical protein VFS70_18010 [Actinomycetota bacterium]|nr:hypothetical protein [Actinomycetota bacterium]